MVLVDPVRVTKSEEDHLYDGGETRFPTSGFIYSVPRSHTGAYNVGDFVCFEEHGVIQDSILQDTFILRLRDGAGTHHVRCDTDIEPVIREYHTRFISNGDDRTITVKDLDANDEQVQFLASDIEDYGIGSYTESGYRLEYRHHLELHPADTRLSHPTLMLVPEREIMFYIQRKDLVNATAL